MMFVIVVVVGVLRKSFMERGVGICAFSLWKSAIGDSQYCLIRDDDDDDVGKNADDDYDDGYDKKMVW